MRKSQQLGRRWERAELRPRLGLIQSTGSNKKEAAPSAWAAGLYEQILTVMTDGGRRGDRGGSSSGVERQQECGVEHPACVVPGHTSALCACAQRQTQT